MAYIGNSPANVGNYQILDDISSSFNGSLTTFALATNSVAITPTKAGQVLISINGVLQEPDNTGTDGFKVSASNVVFSSAPASGDTFWGVFQGAAVDIGTPSDDVVDTIHIKDNAITADKIAAGAVVADIATGGVTTAKIADDAVTVDKLANAINTEIAANTAKTGITSGQASAITANTAKVTNATHTGDVTGSGALTIATDAVTTTKILDGAAISGANLTGLTAGGPSLGTDSVIRTNAQTISENITIGSTTNGMSAGPITIADGYTVTVNGNWSVV